MREHNGRARWWILLLVLIGGGAAWLVRYLRDDDGWTEVRTDTWEPEPAEDEAVMPTVPEPAVPETAVPAAPETTVPETTVPETTAPETTVPEPAAPEPAAPLGLVAEPPSDDLTWLEGVGPKIAAALTAAGLTTFGAVAQADEAALRSALSAAALRYAPSLPTWARQARLLADGDEAGFAELTARLVGGRETA